VSSYPSIPIGSSPEAELRFDSWWGFYHSSLQSPILLSIVPLLFLLYLLLRPLPSGTSAQRFLRGYAWIFTLATLLDLFATGPLLNALGLSGFGAMLLIFPFVLLGDFRVLLLLFSEAGTRPDRRAVTRRAALFTFLVPLTTGLLYARVWLGWADWPSQVLWLIYELGFSAFALWLYQHMPTPALRAIALYVLVYYALWASADVLILLGVDAGWGLRVLPNQLYYAWFVPFAVFRLRRD
jgi:hypothetical protein